MIRFVGFAMLSSLLISCGADGAPVKPILSATTKIGVGSKSGAIAKTSIGLSVGLN